MSNDPSVARPLLHPDQVVQRESIDLSLALECLSVNQRGPLEALDLVARARHTL